MPGKLDFKIKCEGDCERIAKVFIQWLKVNSPELKKAQKIYAPNTEWAIFFSEIYANEVENNNLADQAEINTIQVNFMVEDSKELKLSDLSHEQLLELLEDFLEENNEEEDNNEDESKEN